MIPLTPSVLAMMTATLLVALGDTKPLPVNSDSLLSYGNNHWLILLPGDQILPNNKNDCSDIGMERRFKANTERPIICREPVGHGSTNPSDVVLVIVGGLSCGIAIALLFMGIWASKRTIPSKESAQKNPKR
ncbi:hypothetical protein QR680_008910 [Steinernema hermaphroditum]|uniref:Uncharacterized protein n=1 Tax=Steinernema hermaphroditum TaxID=289476 RepID=A0AA39M8Y9_9BILA|nr:hypothetical protein QR680_008910 [Steinernema hermaphroditum]